MIISLRDYYLLPIIFDRFIVYITPVCLLLQILTEWLEWQLLRVDQVGREHISRHHAILPPGAVVGWRILVQLKQDEIDLTSDMFCVQEKLCLATLIDNVDIFILCQMKYVDINLIYICSG